MFAYLMKLCGQDSILMYLVLKKHGIEQSDFYLLEFLT